MKALPESVVIGPITYFIEEIPDLRDEDGPIFGELDLAGKEDCIRIERDTTIHRKVVVLWHEIIHAILEQAQRFDVPHEIVGVLAYGIVDALHNNAALREFDTE